jgi:hypothetical protein
MNSLLEVDQVLFLCNSIQVSFNMFTKHLAVKAFGWLPDIFFVFPVHFE